MEQPWLLCLESRRVRLAPKWRLLRLKLRRPTPLIALSQGHAALLLRGWKNWLNEALAHGRGVATAPVSVGAMLHHQPTRDSVAKAQRDSIMRFEDALATAQKLRSDGKRSECILTLEKIAPKTAIPRSGATRRIFHYFTRLSVVVASPHRAS